LGPPEPHGAEAADGPLILGGLRVVLRKRSFAVMQVDVQVEYWLLRQRRNCGEQL
jgi:hypothetical protein